MIAHIFVDEYGTPNLEINKRGVEPYFIYTGLIIEDNEIQNARNVHNQIISKYFQNTHLKSSNIKNDDRGHVKRLNIIDELQNFQHYVTALIVDKSKITSDGLTYKQSFIKFFNNLFDKQFFSKYDEFHIHLDKIGWKEFQESLESYMQKRRFVKDLFANNTFELQDDIKEEPLIQLSDFYAGCIGKYYCGKFDKGQADAINNKIRKYLFIDWFPIEYINYFVANLFKTDFCEQIFNIAVKTANDFLNSNDNYETSSEIIKIFLQESHNNPFRHISSKEIKQKLKSKGLTIGDPITEIAKLRDKGVFIVSSSNKKGYKLPCNENEIAEYYDRLQSNIIPQLKRGNTLHRVLIEQSVNKYNILGNEKYSLLLSLINNVVDNKK
ncbi:MAG: DUF3800 domain-containing protein [Prevotellaceae bacterium]|jgi:hypothetical protein|nr:DUF3800 domain-containing protein [Prevotellaceae bacterium]